jgi:ComF family protein
VLAPALFQKTGQALLDLLFPPQCVNCKTASSWLCDDCLKNISFITPPVCDHCGTPKADPASSHCEQCEINPLKYIDGIRSASYFENNPIRPAIHFLKYRNHKAVASILGQMLADTCRRHNLTAEAIVPVPLHISRLRERGYNQCEILASYVGAILGVPVNADSLQRTRQTKSQMLLSANERRQNVTDAFRCCNERLSSKSVLLIDDVCTTGSTLDNCANALKQCGVTSVWGLTLAKAR